MPHKGKLPWELKVRIVEDYLEGRIGGTSITRKYGIHDSTLRDWLDQYKAQGPEGLAPKSHCNFYPTELKQKIVKEYLAGNVSLRDLRNKYAISKTEVIRKWIQKYNGHEELESRGKGRYIYMTKGRITTLEERIEIVEYCISKGKDYRTAINKYGISYQQIYAWVRKYEEQGVQGLDDRRGKHKDAASMTEIERLKVELKLKEAENRRLQIENEVLKKLYEIERRRY